MNKIFVFGFAAFVVVAGVGYYLWQMPPSGKYMDQLVKDKDFTTLRAIYENSSFPPAVRMSAITRFVHNGISTPDIHKEIEKELVTRRDAARIDEVKFIHKLGLARLNKVEVSRYWHRLLDRIGPIVSRKTRNNSTFVRHSKKEKEKSPSSVTVDMIVDYYLLNGSDKWGAKSNGFAMKPGFRGLSLQEISEHFTNLKTVGLILHSKYPVGKYTGGCTGTAYKARMSLFVLDMQNNKIITSHGFWGKEPKKRIAQKKKWGKKCNRTGSLPEYRSYFKLVPPENRIGY